MQLIDSPVPSSGRGEQAARHMRWGFATREERPNVIPPLKGPGGYICARGRQSEIRQLSQSVWTPPPRPPPHPKKMKKQHQKAIAIQPDGALVTRRLRAELIGGDSELFQCSFDPAGTMERLYAGTSAALRRHVDGVGGNDAMTNSVWHELCACGNVGISLLTYSVAPPPPPDAGFPVKTTGLSLLLRVPVNTWSPDWVTPNKKVLFMDTGVVGSCRFWDRRFNSVKLYAYANGSRHGRRQTL